MKFPSGLVVYLASPQHCVRHDHGGESSNQHSRWKHESLSLKRYLCPCNSAADRIFSSNLVSSLNRVGAMFWNILRWLAMALYACSGHHIWLACGHATIINKRFSVYGGIRQYSDSKNPRVGSISNRCRYEDLCYLGSLTIGGRSKISMSRPLKG